MSKTCKLLKFIFAAVLCATYSCSDNIYNIVDNGGGGSGSKGDSLNVYLTFDPTSIDTTIYAEGDEPTTTRATAEITNDNGNSFQVVMKWDAENTIGIFPISPETNAQVSYTFNSEPVQINSVVYHGQGWDLKRGETYAAYYPYKDYFNSCKYNEIELDYAHQKQTGNGDMNHLGSVNDIHYAVADPAVDDNITFHFKRSSALLWLHMTVPREDKFCRVTIANDKGDKIFTGFARLDVSNGNIERITTSDRTSLRLAEITTNTDGQQLKVGDIVDMYLTMAPIDNSKELKSTGNLTIEIRSEEKAYYAHMYPANVGANYGSRLVFKPQTYIRSAVDLGLPSGTIWATCNVGAIIPTDSGYYYGWGEIHPKTEYYWNTYTRLGDEGQTTARGINKYTIPDELYYGKWYDASHNFVGDKITVLQSDDDAAVYNWGGNNAFTWEMPTKEDYEELLKYCTFTWQVDYNGTGVNGYLCTSNVSGYTDKSIFFPAAGYMGRENEDDNVSDQHSYYDDDGILVQENARGINYSGYYWTKTLSDSYTTDAYEFKFNTYTVDNGVDDPYIAKPVPTVVPAKRYVGQSIRPVYHPKK